MKKWLLLVLVVVRALLAWVGSGPYRTWHGIRDAVAQHDAVALSGHVDFTALRRNLKAQLVDEMVRRAGPGMQSSLFGQIALGLGNGVIDGLVELMVSPGGIGGMLQGREVWRSARDSFADPRDRPPPEGAMHEARYRFESISRFTATVDGEDSEPVVFVLQRQGLDWKLVDIRLPLQAASPSPR